MPAPLPEAVCDEVCRLYLEGSTGTEISRMLDIHFATVYRILERRGICRRGYDSYRHYTVDDSFFDCIDSEAKAYWLGFLMADGCIYLGKAGNALVHLSLQLKDAAHIFKFAIAIGSNAPIRIIPASKRSKGSYNIQPLVAINVCSYKLAQGLIKHGCTPRKSKTLRFPTTVPDDLLNHFIRGYFDGDGYLCCGRDNTWHCGLCGTFEFVHTAQQILMRECDLRQIKITRCKDIYYLQYGGNRQVERILDYLYRDSTIHLTRKYQLYLKFKEARKHVEPCAA